MAIIFSNSDKENTYKAMQEDADNPMQRADKLIKELNVLTREYPPTDEARFAKLFNDLKTINAKYPSYFSRESASTNSEIERVESYALYLSYEETLKKSYNAAQKELNNFIDLINKDGTTYKDVIPALGRLNVFITKYFSDENMDLHSTIPTRTQEDQLKEKYKSYRFLQGALDFYKNFSKEKQEQVISPENTAGLKAAVEDFTKLVTPEKQQERVGPKNN